MSDSIQPFGRGHELNQRCAKVRVVCDVARRDSHCAAPAHPQGSTGCVTQSARSRHEHQAAWRHRVPNHSCGDQAETAQPARDDTNPPASCTGVCSYVGRGSFCYDDRMAPESAAALHAVALTKSCVHEKPFPLPPIEHGAGLPKPFRVSAFAEKPPAVCQSKRHLRERIGRESLVHDHQSRWLEELVAVAECGADERRGMETVGGDQQVELSTAKALPAWVCIDVEQRVLDKGEGCKATLRLDQEHARDVREHVALAAAIEDRQED